MHFVSDTRNTPCDASVTIALGFEDLSSDSEEDPEDERGVDDDEDPDEDLFVGARPELELTTAGDVSLDMDIEEVEDDDLDAVD